MSDAGEVESAPVYTSLPKEVTDSIGQGIKLFDKWSYEDVEIRDISLTYVILFAGCRLDFSVKGDMLA